MPQLLLLLHLRLHTLQIQSITQSRHHEVCSSHLASSCLRCRRSSSSKLFQLRQCLLDRRGSYELFHPTCYHNARSPGAQQPSHRKPRPVARHGHKVHLRKGWTSRSGSCHLYRWPRVSFRDSHGLAIADYVRSPCNFAASDVKWCVVASTYDGTFQPDLEYETARNTYCA